MSSDTRKWLGAGAFSLAAATALILAMTWPWAMHFRGEFLAHWDPPFHAWKLELMARRILSGDIFLGSADTNMLYPHSGALYFEALQWPMALFAAPLFAFTRLPSETIYHVTLVFFWALSAPCMLYLLRTLGCGVTAALAGSLVFCIIPHRMSYMVEFQMEMIFAMPLFFAYLIRFFRGGGVADAMLAAISWCLLAVSEFYEAVFVAMAAPFVAVVFATYRPEVVARRRFWISCAAALVVGAALVALLLLPYARLRAGGQVLRPLSEVGRHSLQPFTFILPYGLLARWGINARRDEFSLYPTIAMFALALSGAIYGFARDAARRRSRTTTFLLAFMALASAILFFGIAGAVQFRIVAPTAKAMRLLKMASMAFCLSPAAYAFAHNEGEGERAVFLKSLFAVSALFFFLACGPELGFGADGRRIASMPNSIYLFCHKWAMPFLSGFRVVSRFGVVILFFLVCLATATIDAICAAAGTKEGRIVLPSAVAAAFVGLVALESIPPAGVRARFRLVDSQRSSQAIGWLWENRPDATVAAVPCGSRDIEGMRMFSLLKGDWPYVYAWGGYFPEYSQSLVKTLMSLDPPSTRRRLAELFPECVVVVDKSIRVPFKNGTERPEFALDGTGSRYVDFRKAFSGFTRILAEDGRFAVLGLLPPERESAPRKVFRSDVARRNPKLKCAIEGDPYDIVEITLNGGVLTREAIPACGRLEFECRLAPRALVDNPFNVFMSEASGGGTCAILDFSLSGADGVYHNVFRDSVSCRSGL